MYQSVGAEAIDHYAEAMDLPLYRAEIKGQSLQTDLDYDGGRGQGEGDEVEDLYGLLERIKGEVEFDAVCSGAILSDYQRIRVENV